MIWLDEFHDYFVERLSTITIPDEFDNPVPIHVTYHMPGKEGTPDTDTARPAIVISQYDAVHDRFRESASGPVVAYRDTAEVGLKDPPIPWNLYYEFRILSDYREENVIMETKFLQLFPPRGAILVKDPVDNTMNGFDFFLTQIMPGDGYLETNEAGTTAKRVFRKIYRYKLLTELDFATVQKYKPVQQVNIQMEDNELKVLEVNGVERGDG